MSNDYGPKIKLARLYEKTSAKGNVYLTGRLGAARIAILKSRDVAEDGSPMWDVLLSEGPANSDARRPAPNQAASDPQAPVPAPHAIAPKSGLSDEIPF